MWIRETLCESFSAAKILHLQQVFFASAGYSAVNLALDKWPEVMNPPRTTRSNQPHSDFDSQWGCLHRHCSLGLKEPISFSLSAVFFWARIFSLQSKNKHKHKPRQAYVNWNARRWRFLWNTPRVNQTVCTAKESSVYGLSAEVLAAGESETGTLMFGINQTSLKGIVWNYEWLFTVNAACCSRLTWLIS